MPRIMKRCFCCGRESSLEITDEVNKRYKMYLNGVGYIQDIPLPADQREFLKTGMCLSCQELIFAEPDEE